jgi:hypothetical protein
MVLENLVEILLFVGVPLLERFELVGEDLILKLLCFNVFLEVIDLMGEFLFCRRYRH